MSDQHSVTGRASNPFWLFSFGVHVAIGAIEKRERMNDDNKDEALDRLGGPSKLAQLRAEVEELRKQLDRAKSEMSRAMVRVGSRIVPLNTCNLFNWVDTSGHISSPSMACSIEALGHDWCVVRDLDTGKPYFGLVEGRSYTDLVDLLAPHVY